MSAMLSRLSTSPWGRRLCCLALLGLCAGLGGCCCMPDTRGDGFRDDYSQSFRQIRPPDRDIKAWGFSNKARDIERNLGAQ